MGWRGDDNRDLANERDYKNLPWRKRHLVTRGLFIFAVFLFFAVWVAVSFNRY